MNTTTWSAIRANTVAVIEGLTPFNAPTNVPFARAPRRYDLRKWATKVGSGALRKFEIRRTGTAVDPPVQGPQHVMRNEQARILVAYPILPGLYGDEDLDDCEDLMRLDASQIRDAVFRQTNYVLGQHAAFVAIEEPIRTDTTWFQPLRLDLIYDESVL